MASPIVWIPDANPFAQHEFDKNAPDRIHKLEKGEKLRMRYRVLIHPAGTTVGEFYKAFAGQKGVES